MKKPWLHHDTDLEEQIPANEGKNSLKKKHSRRARTPRSFSNSITFHDVFQELFKTIIVFADFFYLTRFTRHKHWCPLKRVPFAIFSHFDNALKSAVTNVQNVTAFFMSFHDRKFHSMTFQAREMKFLIYCFYVFHDPYEPRPKAKIKNTARIVTLVGQVLVETKESQQTCRTVRATHAPCRSFSSDSSSASMLKPIACKRDSK